MTTPERVLSAVDEFCPASEERVHCPHWWDDEAPCCRCKNDIGAGESDSHLRPSPGEATPLYCPICRPHGLTTPARVQSGEAHGA